MKISPQFLLGIAAALLVLDRPRPEGDDEEDERPVRGDGEAEDDERLGDRDEQNRPTGQVRLLGDQSHGSRADAQRGPGNVARIEERDHQHGIVRQRGVAIGVLAVLGSKVLHKALRFGALVQ